MTSSKITKAPGGKSSGTSATRRPAALRRPPAKGLPRLRHNVRSWWRRLIEVSPLWVLLFVLVSTWCLVPRGAFLVPRVEAGSIADRTYLADRDLSIPDEAETAKRQQQARDEVPPVYDFDRGLASHKRSELAGLFQAGRTLLAEQAEEAPPGRQPKRPPRRPAETGEAGEAGENDSDLLTRLAEASVFKLGERAEAVAELLRRRGFSAEDEDRLSGILTRVLEQGVVSDKELLLQRGTRGITLQDLDTGARVLRRDLDYLDYPEQVEQEVEADLRSWDGLTSSQRKLFAALILANVTPNLTSNPGATRELMDEAAAQAGAVTHTIRKGEAIVRRGDRVDDLAARAIDQLAAGRDIQKLLLTILGTFSLLAASCLLVWLASSRERRRDRSRDRLLSESALLLMFSILGASFARFVAEALSNAFPNEPFNSLQSYAYAIPFAAVALVSTLLYGRDMTLVLSLVFSLLVGHLAGGDAIWTTTVYALAGSLAAVYALDHHQFKQRSAMTRAGAIIGTVNGVALLVLEALGGQVDGGLSQIGFDLVCGFAGGLLAAAVASFAVPIFENLFGITTAIKLIELANPNLPLLRRLALEAPGTFQHSLAVANLAKSGAEAIDGDPLLVNTAALYHDVGKIFRPRYFIENQAQLAGPNPHDKIQPSMSALILINHVKEGVELAHHYHLPQPMFEAIEQHHGTRLIRFFYNKAKERSDPETDEVREDDFRYPGPKPQSKEMGVLMLADGVEAASRTLADPGQQQLRTLLRKLFDDCLHDGQLDDSGLSLGDLRKIESAFLRVLTNIFHQRIDYPGFDFKESSKSFRRTPSGVLKRPEQQAEAEPPDAAPAAVAGGEMRPQRRAS